MASVFSLEKEISTGLCYISRTRVIWVISSSKKV